MKTSFLIIFIIFFVQTFSEDSIKFEKITTRDGLSQENVLCIYQDSIGYIWFGTQNGLSKYDGYNFKTYTSMQDDKTSLSGNVIQTILEDSNGDLWIGTEGNGLNKFDRTTEEFIRFTVGNGSINHSIIKTIAEDDQGNIWIGTYGGGVNKYNPSTKKIKYYRNNNTDENSISSNIINTIFIDSEDNIWIGTENGGLNRYIPESDDFIRYPYSEKMIVSDKSSKKLSGAIINDIYEDEDGDLWIGTWGGGLNRFDIKEEYFSYYGEKNENSSKIIRSISADKNGNLWLGTWDKGAIKYIVNEDRYIYYQHDPDIEGSIGSNRAWEVFVDDSDIVWIGTWGSGISKYVWRNNYFKNLAHIRYNKNSLSNNIVNTIYEDNDGLIWIGTQDGLNRYNRETGDYKHFKNDLEKEDSLPNNTIRAISEDTQGRLWIGTDGGLSLYLKDNNSFKTYTNIPKDTFSLSDNRVYAICEDSYGMLWIGTWSGGINEFDPVTEEFYRYNSENSNLSANNVWSILADSQERLWAGTTYGLNLFNPSMYIFVNYFADDGDSNSISNNSISSIYEDSRGDIWIGTIGGGVNLLNSDGASFSNFTKENILASNNIMGIVEDDDGAIWLSSNKGIMRFYRNSISIDKFSSKDGLKNDNFNLNSILKDKDGNLYFGGNNGVDYFNPQILNKNRYPTPVVLTSLIQGDEEIELEKSLDSLQELVLNYNNNSLKFEYAGLNFIQSEENQYAYMLEGFEEDWNYIGKRTMGIYTNIPDGHYTLRIKAANNDGIWDHNERRLDIVVIPPFWRTNLFRVLSVLVISLAIYYVYKLKLIAIEKNQKKLERLVEERTSQLREKTGKLEKAYQQVKELSRKDVLTGLANRRCMIERLEQEIAVYKRYNRGFSIIISDIDFFKKFNDTYGHELGDIVLKNVGQVMKETIRKEDLAARWGGEEFLLLLPGTQLDAAYKLAERLRQKIMEIECVYDEEKLQITMTFGVAEYEISKTIEANIDKVDQLLYIGKEKGRNCCLYEGCEIDDKEKD